MMARRSDAVRTVCVAVVGLSGMERDKGQMGVGKSCLCNRFMRTLTDDYSVDHISVLSQTDFSGRVVNNDHFLYWGEVLKTADEGGEYNFHVIEQTEFIDDASFQPFKGGKLEPYVKRCAATKITSAEKLMYICKNQLGIEKEYEQKVLPDGKLNIDGFICVFDVSVVPNRTLEKQIEHVAGILNSLMKTKKPIILVTTKNDDSNDAYTKEAEKIIQRKEYKGQIAMIETSAHQNINVELAFIYLAQMIEKAKIRSKVISYAEASRIRKEMLEASTDAFSRLIKAHVKDHRSTWTQTAKKLAGQKEWTYFVELFGLDGSQRLFRKHIKQLREEQLAYKLTRYIDQLSKVLQEMIPDINTLTQSDWPTIQEYLKSNIDFERYFYECPDGETWTEMDLSDTDETRIPFDALQTPEAETMYKNHVNSLQQERKRLEWKKQFKQLLEDTGYVTPGKNLSEVRVFFMGHECFEALSEHDCQQIYDNHQRELVENAKHNFQELLLEHADIFYHFKSIVPSGAITQEDIKEITDVLQDDSRYKLLDRLDQDRKLMLFQHLGFVHCPIREHCPAYPNCMDALIERILGTKVHRPSSWSNSNHWLLSSDNNQLNLVFLGAHGLAEDLVQKIRSYCDADEFEMDGQVYGLDYRIITGDVGLPQNSFRTEDFVPHGSFCVYSNQSSFEYLRDSLEKTLLSNLEKEDKLPFQGLPIVIMFIHDPFIDEKDILLLCEDGQSLADSLQCPFINVSLKEMSSENLVSNALQQLIESIHHRAGFLNIYQTVVESCEPDIRIIMCMFCADPYAVENILGPLLSHQCCFLSGERSIILETFLGDSKRKVEVIISSFHGANAFREELVHGFILLYSAKRKASLATLNAFSFNIPNLPIQIMAVTDSGGANAFFNCDISHQLITEGNATADRLGAHFLTSTSNSQHKTAFYTPFFKEVWDKKPEIEQAFNMEEPQMVVSGDDEDDHYHSIQHARNDGYMMKSNDGSGSENYERLPIISLDSLNGPDDLMSSSDHSDKYAHISSSHRHHQSYHHSMQQEQRSRHQRHHQYGYNTKTNGDSNRIQDHQGFQVYPPPTTPPEPAPPDQYGIRRHMTASQTSLDEITSDVSGSRESLATHDSDGVVLTGERVSRQWSKQYGGHHAFTTGRRRISVPKSRPKGTSQTLKQPGKLNLKNFSIVTEAIARMNVGGGNVKGNHGGKTQTVLNTMGHAPLAAPEDDNEEAEYAKIKELMPTYGHSDSECPFTLEQESLANKLKPSKTRQRREKGQPSYSDTDSEWSSLERRQRASEVYCKVNRKSSTHKRARKKRSAIPVQPPRVPPLGMYVMPPELPPMATNVTPVADDKIHLDGNDKPPSEYNSDSSEGSDIRMMTQQHKFNLKKNIKTGTVLNMDMNSKLINSEIKTLRNTNFMNNYNMHPFSNEFYLSKQNSFGFKQEDDSSLDVSSPRDNNSPMFGIGSKFVSKECDREKLIRKKEKQKAKDDEKLEKRRIKEEKLRKVAEKEKEREKKKQKNKQQQQKSSSAGSGQSMVLLENGVPKFLEKCIHFIEAEGLDSEGIYRVPGNRAHVDLLFQKFEEDSSVIIGNLDIPVNAVATALKDFFSKRLPPLLDEELMAELEDIAGARGFKPMSMNMEMKTDRSCRLLALRGLLNKLPNVNFAVLKFIFQHFVRISDNSKLNSMDSKNLAICWWPTLFPIEFSDMGRFEQMRPYLEDIFQTMIDQFPFLFCGQEAIVMV